ncbi:MAG TPA: anaerobic sulfatase maturase [Candidatus Merdenecus merdavium]|nr:anaerobic sulfatase maturase [Candidatus Merdenecus merdavium]
MKTVNMLIKPSSGLCNMKCDYCFYCDEAQKREQESYGFMSDQTLKNVIRKSVLAAEHSCTIGFQGGEPTLIGLEFFQQVISYVNQYNKRKIQILYTLQTNGYGITKEWCEFFKKHNFLLGLSVDGVESIHNSYRHNKKGEGTYKRILETVSLFEQYQIEYNILTVVHEKTAKNIKEIYRDYKKRGWKYLQFIACLDPLGEERGKQEYSLLPKTYGQFLIDLFDLWYEDWNKGDGPFIRQFDNYIAMICGYLPESCEQRGICGIQHVVEADGSVYPCDFYALDEWRIGNLNDNSMKEIQEKRKEIGFIERSFDHSQQCKECKWYPLCKGGCFRNRENEVNNYFCEGYGMFFEACYPRMREMADKIKAN